MVTRKKAPAKRGVYPSYLFKTHDPIIDAVATLIKDSGVTYSFIQQKSGVTNTTLHSWFKRKTKRPQFATVKAVVKACGADLQIIETPAEERRNKRIKKHRFGIVQNG